MHTPFNGFKKASYPTGSITQYFGENHDLYSTSVCYGTECLQGHNGIDLVSSWGTPIFCVEEGVVVEAKEETTGYGKDVRVVNFDTGNEWTYGHLSRIDCTIGVKISQGDQIGLMGNTGFVISGNTPFWKVTPQSPYPGTHLHLQLRKVSKPGATWNTVYPSGDRAVIQNYTNGFFGAIDFIDLLPGELNTKFLFNIDMSYGQTSTDIKELQKRLGVDQTGYYGKLTRQAVLDFQIKNTQLSWWERYVLAGSKVGPKTRQALNK